MTCYYQALMILVWFRKAEDTTLLGAEFGVSRATAYRYIAEGLAVLAAQRPDLHDALRHAAEDGWAFVILHGKLFDSDRLAETTASVKGQTIDAWYSGKHRDLGANIQAVIIPNGLPIWTAGAMPGHLHDLSCARDLGVTAALNPARQPADGKPLVVADRTLSRLLRGLRWQGQRGFAMLTGRRRTLRHSTINPGTRRSRSGDAE